MMLLTSWNLPIVSQQKSVPTPCSVVTYSSRAGQKKAIRNWTKLSALLTYTPPLALHPLRKICRQIGNREAQSNQLIFRRSHNATGMGTLLILVNPMCNHILFLSHRASRANVVNHVLARIIQAGTTPSLDWVEFKAVYQR